MKLPFGPKGNASDSVSNSNSDSNSNPNPNPNPEEPILIFDVPRLGYDFIGITRMAKCGIYQDFFSCREKDGSVSNFRYSELELSQLIDAARRDAKAKRNSISKSFWLYVKGNPSLSWLIYDRSIPNLDTTLYNWLESRVPNKRPQIDTNKFVNDVEGKLNGVLADRYAVEKLENGTALCVFVIREKGGRFSSKIALTVKLFPYEARWEIDILNSKFDELAKQIKDVMPATDAEYRMDS